MTLPDLAPMSPHYVDAGPGSAGFPLDLVLGQPPSRVIRFPTYAMNVGDYPLELLGTPTADPERWVAEQCTSWQASRVCRERREVGEMQWHPAHNHFHFQNFARYDLRRLTAERLPDFSAEGVLASSPKVSFCLQDSDSQGPMQPERPPLYAGCPGAVQGISPGWMDLYDISLPGQSLSTQGVADGFYAVVITLDPENLLAESDESDNVAYSIIELYDDGTQARLVERVEATRSG